MGLKIPTSSVAICCQWQSSKRISNQKSIAADTFAHFIRLEEAVAGLKEGEAEIEGVLKKLERGNEAVAAFKNQVRQVPKGFYPKIWYLLHISG